MCLAQDVSGLHSIMKHTDVPELMTQQVPEVSLVLVDILSVFVILLISLITLRSDYSHQ